MLEDNDLLCRSLCRTISSWGAKVEAATRVDAALSLLTAPLDLLVSDVRLPDGTAHAVFERAARLEPRPLMIAISGRATPSEAFELARAGVHCFLPKPFKLAELERAIAGALSRKDARESRPSALSAAARRSIETQLQRFARAQGLSEQQTQLLRLMLSGVARKELPAALGVSANTCKTMVRRLLARCGASHATDLVRELLAKSAAPARRTRVDSAELT